MDEKRYNEIKQNPSMVKELSDEEFEEVEKLSMGKKVDIEVQGVGCETNKIKLHLSPFEEVKETKKEWEEILGKKGYKTIVTTNKATYRVSCSGNTERLEYGQWRRCR